MKTKCIIKLSAYFIFSLVLGIFIVTSFVSCFKKICEEERKEQEIFKKSVEIKNSNPCIYEVIFTDGGKDTIKVWGDKIEMREDGRDLFARPNEVVLFYVPFRAYKVEEVSSVYYPEKKLYNVVRFRKINTDIKK